MDSSGALDNNLGIAGKVVFGLIVAGAVVISSMSAPGPIGLLGAGLAIVMATIAVIDWRSFIIPDWLSLIGLALGAAHAIAQDPDAIPQAIELAALRGALLALIFFALRAAYARIRGRDGIGLGDVKLAAVAGVWLDWMVIPVAVEIAAFVAVVAYVLRQMLLRRSFSATNRIPFGLFFGPAIWICWLLEARLSTAF